MCIALLFSRICFLIEEFSFDLSTPWDFPALREKLPLYRVKDSAFMTRPSDFCLTWFRESVNLVYSGSLFPHPSGNSFQMLSFFCNRTPSMLSLEAVTSFHWETTTFCAYTLWGDFEVQTEFVGSFAFFLTGNI